MSAEGSGRNHLGPRLHLSTVRRCHRPLARLVSAATLVVCGSTWASVVWPSDVCAAPPKASPATVLPAEPFGPAAALLATAPEGEQVEVISETSRALVIARVAIEGREQVSARQIRAVLGSEGIEAGAEILWPSDERVERARRRLRATGYFKRVTLRVEPVDDDPNRVLLVVDVAERSTVAVQRLYLGGSRMTPFRGGVDLVERNFLGRAIQFGGAFVWSTRPTIDKGRRQQAYELFVESPPLGNTKIAPRASGRFVSAGEPYRVSGAADNPDPSHFRSFEYDRVGGGVGVVFHMTPNLVLDTGYRFERVEALLPTAPSRVRLDGTIEDVDLRMRPGRHRYTTAEIALGYDNREQAFLAGKGGRFVLDLQVSSPAVGSEYEFIKLVAGGAYSFRLPWRHWLTPSAFGGQIAGRAPIFERLYAGDLSAWTPGRELGLRFSTRNPIDVFKTGIDSRPYGDIFGRFDLEYVWPLFRRTRTRTVYGGDLFFGAGVFTLVGDAAERQAFRDAGQRVTPVGFNANIGLRLDTGLGTFNISVGNVLQRTPL